MARVFQGERTFLHPVLRPLENLIYRICGIEEAAEQSWKRYAGGVLVFSAVSLLLTYLWMRVQQWLPWNPQGLGNVAADLGWNTAASFTTNTNWQAYTPETTMSYLTQMAALATHNFFSAAVGMAVAIAVVRGFARHSSKTLGNFWVDFTRSIVYVLLPISIVVALLLCSQGVIQNLHPYTKAATLEGAVQTIPQGPAASQEVIKLLGTNGGGFTNANSAHPFENPTPFANFIQMLLIFVIPAGLTYTFGKMVRDTRQGWALLAAMTVLFLAGVFVFRSEFHPDAADLRDSSRADLHVRQNGARYAAGLGAAGRHDGAVPGWRVCRLSSRTDGQPDIGEVGPANPGHGDAARRQHGGQGSPLRHRQFGPVHGCHHGRELRRGEQRARQSDAAGRAGAAGQHRARRSGFRRRRLGALRHTAVRHSGGVHRRADGGAHAGVPGQEDRAEGSEDGDAGGDGAGVYHPGNGRGGDQPEHGRQQLDQSRAAWAFRGAVRLHFGGRQQRQRVCRPERQHAVPQHHAGVSDAFRTISDADSAAGGGGKPGGQKAGAGFGGDFPHARAAVRGAAGGRGGDCGGVDLLPGAFARSRGGTFPDATGEAVELTCPSQP